MSALDGIHSMTYGAGRRQGRSASQTVGRPAGRQTGRKAGPLGLPAHRLSLIRKYQQQTSEVDGFTNDSQTPPREGLLSRCTLGNNNNN